MEYRNGDKVTIYQIVESENHVTSPMAYNCVSLNGVIIRKSSLQDDDRYRVQFNDDLGIHSHLFRHECFVANNHNPKARIELINRIKERSKLNI